MKKLLGFLLVLCLVLGGAQATMAASSCAQAFKCYGDGSVCLMTLTWTAHTDGTFTSTALTAANVAKVIDYQLCEVEIDPGTTAPTLAYDVTLTRTATGVSYDILGGRGANCDNTTTTGFLPANATGTRYPFIGDDTYTLGIANNSVSGATGKIRLWFHKGGCQ